MLFAHGFGCDQNMWRFLTPAFADRYKIVLFDYVGSGKSDLSAYDERRYGSLNGYAQDVLDICEALDLRDVIFVGHSVSSVIGVLAANRAPERFERLIFLGPSASYINDPPDYIGGFDRPDIEGLLEMMDKNYLGWASFLAPAVMKNPEQSELTAELEQSFCATDPKIARRFAEITFLSDNRADFPKLQVPALILQCTDDMIAPIAVGEWLARADSAEYLPHFESDGPLPAHERARRDDRGHERISRSAGRCLTTGQMPEPAMDSLLDRAPCGYIAFSDEGIMRMVNATIAELLGYTPEELIGRHFETLLSVGARIFYHTHFFPVLKLHGEAEEVYLTLRSRSGLDIPVLTNGVRRERAGEMESECVFVRMSQRSQYEDEILRAKREAEAASAAKAKFLSMMSHELRTPLQAISGYCDLLLQEVSGPITAEQRSDLGAVQSASGELVRLLQDILDFARLESGAAVITLADVSVETALKRAEALVNPKLTEAHLRYQRIACAADLRLRANADRLQQVLLNLLTNAIKFTPRKASSASNAVATKTSPASPSATPAAAFRRNTSSKSSIPSCKWTASASSPASAASASVSPSAGN